MFSLPHVDPEDTDILFEKLKPEIGGWIWKTPFAHYAPSLFLVYVVVTCTFDALIIGLSQNWLIIGQTLPRLVFSRFLDLLGNLGIVKDKPTRKTCFSREKKRLAPRIYQAKFCLAAFLWSQRNLYYIFTRNRC